MRRSLKVLFNSIRCSLFFLIAALLLSQCKSGNQPVNPRPMQVLFLGHDSKHHDSQSYLPYLTAALSGKGFHFSYTEDPSDLTGENLQSYDALMLYANHDEISDEAADALLSFVRSGGAFVPIHCASYCFRNSKEVVKLIGGQFLSHDTATFKAEIIAADHPAMSTVKPFTSWDETYVHTKFSKDITVLMERVEGAHREPYTWVKDYGKGRVFYTALGHDQRTWREPAFHHLLEQGLRWAIGDQKLAALQQLDLPQLSYTEAKIPNYEERDPPPMLQAPLSASESQAYIQVPPGFQLELFAEEPDILNPIHMSWDEKGRLWVIETKDYPNEIKKELGKGSDRIKILEDTNGDGKADKFTVFAENLSVPTSMTFSNGGIIVSQAPYFLFLKDTTGDDKADVMQVIMEGWGTSDTHAGPSNLKYGYDNQIWGVLGYSGFNGSVGGEQHEFSQGAYRFSPDGSELEFMGATSNNTWGLAFNEDFDIFLSTANNTHSAFLGIPHKHFESVEGLKIKSVKKIDGHYHFHPNTNNYRQVDVFGGFTAAAGHSFYTARDFPSAYWNRVALVCEPTGHLLHRAIIDKDGAGYKEKDGWNLLASADEWVSPVCAEVGPDGAVWILDWYNFIIQHNPTPVGFENGLGNAHINPLRDKQHGRIYRLTHTKASHQTNPHLSITDVSGLLKTLKHDNMLWRLHAQRLLVERGKVDIGQELLQLIQDQSVSEQNLNVGAQHALWTLHGLDLVNENHPDILQAVFEALRHPSGAVRKNAIRVLPRNLNTLVKFVEQGVYEDRDPSTVLATILALAEMPSIAAVGDRLYTLSRMDMVKEDEWLSRAVYVAAIRHKEVFTKAIHRADAKSIKDGFSITKQEIDWSGVDVDVSDWVRVPVPSRWNKTGVAFLEDFDGVLWLQKSFDLPSNMAGRAATLSLGLIDDGDHSYVNGEFVGSGFRKWGDIRNYKIRPGLLKAGKNVITTKITDNRGRGGIHGEPETLFVRVGAVTINISGDWLCKIEEQYFPDRSIFAEGLSIRDLFLLHYGPYAQNLSRDLETAEQAVQNEIIIKTKPDQMRYDPEYFEVTSGETLKISFVNNDNMQHNLLIGQPGSLELIGRAADNMAQTSAGATWQYIPELPQILVSAGLVDPGETRTLLWQVPSEPGEYPFVCTFPGHWKTMKGVIKVSAPTL